MINVSFRPYVRFLYSSQVFRTSLLSAYERSSFRILCRPGQVLFSLSRLNRSCKVNLAVGALGDARGSALGNAQMRKKWGQSGKFEKTQVSDSGSGTVASGYGSGTRRRCIWAAVRFGLLSRRGRAAANCGAL